MFPVESSKEQKMEKTYRGEVRSAADWSIALSILMMGFTRLMMSIAVKQVVA